MDVIMIYLFIVGLFFGSFYNVVATRLCKNESIISPRSHCVNCNHILNWYELIPVFSYAFLKGKCKKCKTKISIQYPLAEIATGILFALSYYVFGFTYETLISLIAVSVVVITFITDCKYMVILDEVLVVGIVLICLLYYIAYGWMYLLKHLIYGLLLLLVMVAIKFIGDHAFKQESLGWGDITLSFFAGLLLGLKMGVFYIFLGSFLALPYAIISSIRKKESIIPFGPFLVTSLLIIFWNASFFASILDKLLGVQL